MGLAFFSLTPASAAILTPSPQVVPIGIGVLTTARVFLGRFLQENIHSLAPAFSEHRFHALQDGKKITPSGTNPAPRILPSLLSNPVVINRPASHDALKPQDYIMVSSDESNLAADKPPIGVTLDVYPTLTLKESNCPSKINIRVSHERRV